MHFVKLWCCISVQFSVLLAPAYCDWRSTNLFWIIVGFKVIQVSLFHGETLIFKSCWCVNAVVWQRPLLVGQTKLVICALWDRSPFFFTNNGAWIVYFHRGLCSLVHICWANCLPAGALISRLGAHYGGWAGGVSLVLDVDFALDRVLGVSVEELFDSLLPFMAQQ